MFSWGVSFPTRPRMGCRSPARPRKVARTLHCAPAVSCAGSPRKGYAPCTTIPARGFGVGVVSTYESRGVTPHPPDYIVCTSTVGVDIVCTSLGYIVCVVWVLLSRCGWCVVGVATYASAWGVGGGGCVLGHCLIVGVVCRSDLW